MSLQTAGVRKKKKRYPKTCPDGGKQGKHYNAGSKNQKLNQHHNYENR